MVQFQVLSGRMAGMAVTARQVPFRLGRGPHDDIRLEADGVWERHLEIGCDATGGLELRSRAEAITSVNGQPVQTIALRNGDSIEIGSLKLRFWLSAARQRSFRSREALTWMGLVLLAIFQAWLVFSLVD